MRHVIHRPGRAALAALTVAGLAALSMAGIVGAQGGRKDTSADKIKVAAAAEKPDASGKQVVTLTIEVVKGWHIYANPVGNDDLDATKTVITFASKGKAVPAAIAYPEGKLVVDATLGNYRVYEDRVAIKATVQRPDASAPLEATVKINACDAKKCFPPGQVTVNVP